MMMYLIFFKICFSCKKKKQQDFYIDVFKSIDIVLQSSSVATNKNNISYFTRFFMQ